MKDYVMVIVIGLLFGCVFSFIIIKSFYDRQEAYNKGWDECLSFTVQNYAIQKRDVPLGDAELKILLKK